MKLYILLTLHFYTIFRHTVVIAGSTWSAVDEEKMEGTYLISNLTAVQLLNEDDNMLTELAELFSKNYGKWSARGTHPGQQVIMSRGLMKRLLLFDPDACGAFVASVDKTLIGHVFYYKFSTNRLNTVCWITQLVTRRDVRHKGIASSLVKAILASDNFSACGLVSSHPYAIRALEKACACQCDRTSIDKYYKEFMYNSRLPYINSSMTLSISGTVDTEFNVDHGELLKIIEKEKELCRWNFGDLLDGHEFFAFCFF